MGGLSQPSQGLAPTATCPTPGARVRLALGPATQNDSPAPIHARFSGSPQLGEPNSDPPSRCEWLLVRDAGTLPAREGTLPRAAAASPHPVHPRGTRRSPGTLPQPRVFPETRSCHPQADPRSSGNSRAPAPGPRLTAGALEVRGRAVPQRGAPARASLVLLRLLRGGGGGAGAPRGAGALGFVVRGAGRGGARGGRRAVEGVPAAVRARLAEHVVRDVQALVARAGRLEQRRRPPPRAPAALGHGPGRRPRAGPPQRLPAARAGPRARAAARRPPPAQPAAQRPPPRARPARRLGRLGPSARGSARSSGAAGCGPRREAGVAARARRRRCVSSAPAASPCALPAEATRAPRPTFPGASLQRRAPPPRASSLPANGEPDPGREGGAGRALRRERPPRPPPPGRGEASGRREGLGGWAGGGGGGSSGRSSRRSGRAGGTATAGPLLTLGGKGGTKWV